MTLTVGGAHVDDVCHLFQPGLSQPKALTFDALTQSYLNTPKMLELDINRMLIAQNQIR